MTQVASFIAANLPYAQSVSAQTGLPVNFVLGQAGLESGWGTSAAATQGNNFFGLSPGGSLASYASPAAGWQAYSDLINGSYSGVAGSTTDPLGLAQGLVAGGYNSADPAYAGNVAAATQTVAQTITGTGGGGLWGWLQQHGLYQPAPNGQPGWLAPGAGNPFGQYGPLAGGGPGFSSWAGELATRALLVLVGLTLFAAGFMLAGRRAVDARPSGAAR